MRLYALYPMCFVFIFATEVLAFHKDSLVDNRVEHEEETSEQPFVITPYKANYILPISYNQNPHQTPFEGPTGTHPNSVENLEARFQISFKIALWRDIFNDNGRLDFAFTSKSWWQVYNQVISSPFRETNYEPELYLLFENDWEIAGFTNTHWNIGFSHQSNGQSGDVSRSWNRLYASFLFDAGDLVVIPKIWWRIPQDTVTYKGVLYGDENPGIENYLGNFELLTIYGWRKNRFTMLLRNNLKFDNDNRGAVRLTWSYPILEKLRLYVEYFNGYGDSLLEYNTQTQVIGIGVALNDLL